MGVSGCEGEDPCDDLDACCRDHDSCVEIKGTIDIFRNKEKMASGSMDAMNNHTTEYITPHCLDSNATHD